MEYYEKKFKKPKSNKELVQSTLRAFHKLQKQQKWNSESIFKIKSWNFFGGIRWPLLFTLEACIQQFTFLYNYGCTLDTESCCH